MNFDKLFKEKVLQYQDLYCDFNDLYLFNEKLNEITKGKDFIIQNPIIWKSILALRNTLFINVVEWIGSIAISKNDTTCFLCKVQADYLKNLSIPSKKKRKKIKLSINSTADDFAHEHWQNYIDSIMINFFKNCRNNPTKHQNRLCSCDIDFLQQKLKKIYEKLKNARHINAHPYSNISNVNSISLIHVCDALKEIKIYLGYIASISNVVVGLDCPVRSYCNETKLVENMIDLILCGTISQVPYIMQDIKVPYIYTISKDREDFYEKLHKFHDNQKNINANYNKAFNYRDKTYFQFSDIYGNLFK